MCIFWPDDTFDKVSAAETEKVKKSIVVLIEKEKSHHSHNHKKHTPASNGSAQEQQ